MVCNFWWIFIKKASAHFELQRDQVGPSFLGQEKNFEIEAILCNILFQKQRDFSYKKILTFSVWVITPWIMLQSTPDRFLVVEGNHMKSFEQKKKKFENFEISGHPDSKTHFWKKTPPKTVDFWEFSKTCIFTFFWRKSTLTFLIMLRLTWNLISGRIYNVLLDSTIFFLKCFFGKCMKNASDPPSDFIFHDF